MQNQARLSLLVLNLKGCKKMYFIPMVSSKNRLKSIYLKFRIFIFIFTMKILFEFSKNFTHKKKKYIHIYTNNNKPYYIPTTISLSHN